MTVLPIYIFNGLEKAYRIWYRGAIYYPKYDWRLRITHMNQTAMTAKQFKEAKQNDYTTARKSYTT